MEPDEFVSRVVDLYTRGIGIFKRRLNAEELIPEEQDPLSKSLYIFYVLQLDYAIKSQTLYRGALELFKTNPSFFTTQFISKLSKGTLEKYLKDYLHPRYINEAVRRYLLNTQQLVTAYNGDPRKIFENATSCQTVIFRLKAFRGFGPKIGNFFIRTMINTFNYRYADISTMLPPVDIHDVRIAFMLDYTNTDKMTLKNVNHVKELWRDACLKSKQNWLVFDKALWLLGSEGKPKDKAGLLSMVDND